MELYGFFRSSTSYRLRIALAFKGLDYEPHYVSLPKMEHRTEDYMALNPQGLVPALVDGGEIFAQSLAVMEYLEEAYPAPPMLPEGMIERAYVRSASQIIGCDVHPLNNIRVLKYLRNRWSLSEADSNEWYAHWVAEGFRSFEATLAAKGRSGRFVLGDAPGMADICLVPQVFNARRFDCDLSAFPRTLAIFENCMKIDSFIKTQPQFQADAF
ncbi:maleylacetoacetate isomerase [Aquabacter sp. CN5-332]